MKGRTHALDGDVSNETIQRDNQPTHKRPGGTPKNATGSFVKPDGINKMVENTNNTRAPGQWGKS